MRTLAIAKSPLIDGFTLLGIETYADLSADEIAQLLSTLMQKKQKAMVYLQNNLLPHDNPQLQQIRDEGGNILISELPEINQAAEYESPVDHMISRVMGSQFSEDIKHG